MINPLTISQRRDLINLFKGYAYESSEARRLPVVDRVIGSLRINYSQCKKGFNTLEGFDQKIIGEILERVNSSEDLRTIVANVS